MGYDLFKATNKPPWHTETSMIAWRMKMLNPKEWGDETAVVLASELLHVDIQIIPAFGEVTIIKSSSESSNKQLFSLFHYSEVDFYSGYNARVIRIECRNIFTVWLHFPVTLVAIL